MSGNGYSFFELGYDDGYEYVKQNDPTLFYDREESEDFKRGFRAGMKAAREELANVKEH